MELHLSKFLLALTFLTRLPIGRRLGQTIRVDDRLSDSFQWFPLVGLLVGLLSGSVYLFAAQNLPYLAAAVLAVAASILITGALHEDGLADCADGLGNHGDKDRILHIMRDSQIGTYGALALILSVSFRVALLCSLAPWQGFLVLVVAHMVSKSTMPLGPALADYARSDGLGSLAKGRSNFILPAIIALSLAILFKGISGLLAGILAFAVAWIFLIYLVKRIGGYTGDGLGAMEQLSHMSALAILAIAHE